MCVFKDYILTLYFIVLWSDPSCVLYMQDVIWKIPKFLFLNELIIYWIEEKLRGIYISRLLVVPIFPQGDK